MKIGDKVKVMLFNRGPYHARITGFIETGNTTMVLVDVASVGKCRVNITNVEES